MRAYRPNVLAKKYSTTSVGGATSSTTVAKFSSSKGPATVTATVSTRMSPNTAKSTRASISSVVDSCEKNGFDRTIDKKKTPLQMFENISDDYFERFRHTTENR